MRTCTLVFDYFGSDGFAHCHADCGMCYTVLFAYSPSGPWFKDRDGMVGDDIPIAPGGGTKYYRVIPRECTPAEIDPSPTPESEPE